MVEVAHDVSESLALGADEVLHGDPDVLEDDIRGGAEAISADFDFARPDAFGARDQEEGNTIRARATCSDGRLARIVRPGIVGSWDFFPLLSFACIFYQFE